MSGNIRARQTPDAEAGAPPPVCNPGLPRKRYLTAHLHPKEWHLRMRPTQRRELQRVFPEFAAPGEPCSPRPAPQCPEWKREMFEALADAGILDSPESGYETS